MTHDAPHDTSTNDGHQKVVDPSDAVVGLGFVFGAIGGLIGVIAAVILSPEFSGSTLYYCFMAGLAGGSAGIVTGGMVGALFSVARGNRR